MHEDRYSGNALDELDKYVEHYGTPRHSGRYPYGSGEHPYQHDEEFLGHVYKLRSQGLKETEIAKSMMMTTTELRSKISKATQEVKAYQTSEAVRLYAKGYSKVAIGKQMGLNESSVRLLLDPVMRSRRSKLQANVDFLKEQVEKYGMIDTGSGTELGMSSALQSVISADALRKAVKTLEEEGYSVLQLSVPQMSTGHDTKLRVLAKPGTTKSDAMKNRDKIHLVDGCYIEEGKVRKIAPPVSIDPKRIMVRYDEDGGSDKDGCIEIRPGVKDLDLGGASYAQVRIAVNGTHYIKGVAVRCRNVKDMPDGVDIIVNSNKKRGVPLLDSDPDKKQVLKPMQKDPDNPFGATIRFPEELRRAQAHYIDDNGEKQQSALNIVSEEGTWAGWTRSLPSQFLGKQSPVTAKKQLTLQHDIYADELKEIEALTNPTVKRELLNEFAGKCSSAATHMSAAAFPRQSTRLLLPFKNVKDGEIFCPGLNNGEHVIMVRYPHAGIFEIPYLTVNNNIREAKETIGNAIDACGISPKTALQLSGADYDGDTATVIPVDNLSGIRVSRMIDDLKNFNAGEEFPATETSHRMTKSERNREMGSVSNLITDMTIKGASEQELVRAVKHSMVVIDAYKHHYNYKLSEEVYGIAELKKKYQGGANAGASTLLSRSTSELHIPQRRMKFWNEMTPEEQERWKAGENIYKPTGKTYSKPKKDALGNKTGEYTKELKTDKISKMENAFDIGLDAYSLASEGKETTNRIERVYADYANSMKALERKALAEARACVDIEYSPEARKVYKKEYDELLEALEIAHRNRPLERAAQIFANKEYANKIKEMPDLDQEKKKKLKSDILKRARIRFGAGKHTIKLTDKQWEAISAGAVTKSVLQDILSNADKERVKNLAMPKSSTGIGTAKLSRARQLLRNGYSQEDVAYMIGVSVTTMMSALEKER